MERENEWSPEVVPLYADNPNTNVDPDWFEED